MITQAELTLLNKFESLKYSVVLESEIIDGKLSWFLYVDQNGSLEPLFSRSGDKRAFRSLDTLYSHLQEHCSNASSITLLATKMPNLKSIDFRTSKKKKD